MLEMVLMVNFMIKRFTFEIINDSVPINKTMWTSYVKFVGMVCG